MAIENVSAVDFGKIPALKFRPEVAASAPTDPAAGQLWFDSTNSRLMSWDGTAWVAATMVAGAGLELSGGALRIAAAAAGDGLSGGAGAALAVNAGAGLELSSDALRIAAAAAGNGLTGGGGVALAVNPGTGLEISSDTVRIATAAAGNGLIGGGGSALAVGAGTGITVAADAISVDQTVIASRAYVDGVAQGLDVKASVRLASTVNVNTASPGTTFDGVTAANGDRILLKNQTTTSQNGIWVFNGSAAAMTRPTDADSAGDLSGGAFTFVEEGTTHADTGWVIDSPSGSITPGTTAHTWAQFSGAGSIDAGAGLTKSGNTVNVIGAANGGITVNADSIQVDGTVTRKSVIAQSLATATQAYAHGLGHSDIDVTTIRLSDGRRVEVDWTADSTNVTFYFDTAPVANTYKFVVHG